MSLSKDGEAKLVADFNAASVAIRAGKAGKLQGIENAYGLAYNRMAMAGLAQPLKKKYRNK